MENNKDKSQIIDQINYVKKYNDKIKECLSSIELLIVDDNNSRVKDPSLRTELSSLSNAIDSLSSSINSIEKKL